MARTGAQRRLNAIDRGRFASAGPRAAKLSGVGFRLFSQPADRVKRRFRRRHVAARAQAVQRSVQMLCSKPAPRIAVSSQRAWASNQGFLTPVFERVTAHHRAGVRSEKAIYPDSLGNAVLITDPFLPLTATGYRLPSPLLRLRRGLAFFQQHFWAIRVFHLLWRGFRRPHLHVALHFSFARRVVGMGQVRRIAAVRGIRAAERPG